MPPTSLEGCSGDYRIELGRANQLPSCECCGHPTQLVRGFVYRKNTARAVYLVRWKLGSTHDAEVALLVGDWCDADQSSRRMVGLRLRQTSDGPAFTVVDADASRWDNSPELGAPMSAKEVTGTDFGREVNEILDAVGAIDGRLHQWRLSSSPNDAIRDFREH